jgi:uncharacterized protein (TIGR03437 family)
VIQQHDRYPLRKLRCAALLLGWIQVAGGFQLSVPQVSLPREGSAVLKLTFNPPPEAIATIQFDLDYDHSSIELIANIGEAARAAGKSLTFVDVSANKRRFIIFGLNQTLIGPGELVNFTAGAAPDAAQRGYSIGVSNLTVVTPSGFPAATEAVNGTITVTSETGPRLLPEAVRSAASLRPGSIAPGEILTLFGSNIGPSSSSLPEVGLTSPLLGGASVWFGGKQAPLLYADASQISAVAPFSLAGESVSVQVRKGDAVWGETQVPLQAAAPSLFTLGWSGAGGAAAINYDPSAINDIDHLALRGSVVSLFATGGGQMTPAGVDGALGIGASQFPLLPVRVTIGGLNAEVLYTGVAPGLVQGVVQINVRIPIDAPAGPAVAVTVIVGDFASPAGVTLAIR